jgi:exodeoxyribonuclease-5
MTVNLVSIDVEIVARTDRAVLAHTGNKEEAAWLPLAQIEVASSGFEGRLPKAGDRLVCLRNDNKLGIFNGGLFEVVEAEDDTGGACIEMLVQSEDFPNRAPVEIRVRREFFLGGAEEIDWRDLRGTHQFDFGYALTTHKAQGSQWADVSVYDESGVFREDWRRWLYTAITRASDRITVVTTGAGA